MTMDCQIKPGRCRRGPTDIVQRGDAFEIAEAKAHQQQCAEIHDAAHAIITKIRAPMRSMGWACMAIQSKCPATHSAATPAHQEQRASQPRRNMRQPAFAW
jgi:hypothetical protein